MNLAAPASDAVVAGGLIHWAAAQHGPRPSLVLGERCFTHADIETRSNRMAQALIASGLQPGERLAVLLENSVESVDSVFGAEKAALTYVALNARHTLAEHLDILADAQASAVLVGPQFAALADAFAQQRGPGRRLPALRQVMAHGFREEHLIDMDTACAAAEAIAPQLKVTPDHIVRIAYTSGTTGKPKGVAYTVERWLARLRRCCWRAWAQKSSRSKIRSKAIPDERTLRILAATAQSSFGKVLKIFRCRRSIGFKAR